MFSSSASPARTEKYEATPLYAHSVWRSDGTSSATTSSRGRYQRVGSPVSNSGLGRDEDANVTSPEETTTWRELRRTSTRWYGSTACAISCSSSSNHASSSSHGMATYPSRSGAPAGGSTSSTPSTRTSSRGK